MEVPEVEARTGRTREKVVKDCESEIERKERERGEARVMKRKG